MTTTTTPALDHLILFLPASPSTNLPQVPDFLSENFTLTPGGTHADGLTSNALILLPDGSYIELITFIPSAPPPSITSHWWAPFAQNPGWADWCLTNSLSPEANHARVSQSHQEPRHGGRKRADGVDVKWAVTFPKGENGGQASRGRVPFFCHDITERGVRVPLDEEKTRHASGVLGVASLTVIVKDGEALREVRRVYDTLFGDAAEAQDGLVRYEVKRVVAVKELEGAGGAQILLRVAQNESEREKVGERGFLYGDVVLAAKAGDGKEQGRRERIDGDLRGLWMEYV